MSGPHVKAKPERKKPVSKKIALREFKSCTLLYHLTPPKYVEQIEREGICADEGNIFAFTDLIAASSIAMNQVGADPYAVFWIEAKGITGKLYADDVAESTRRLQCIIRQERIEPQFVHYLGTMALDRNTLAPWQRLLDASRGFSRQQSEAMFEECLKFDREMSATAAK